MNPCYTCECSESEPSQHYHCVSAVPEVEIILILFSFLCPVHGNAPYTSWLFFVASL